MEASEIFLYVDLEKEKLILSCVITGLAVLSYYIVTYILLQMILFFCFFKKACSVVDILWRFWFKSRKLEPIFSGSTKDYTHTQSEANIDSSKWWSK